METTKFIKKVVPICHIWRIVSSWDTFLIVGELLKQGKSTMQPQVVAFFVQENVILDND